jgi:hypothetical protein
MSSERLIVDPNEERRWDPRVDLFQEISCEKGGEVVHSGVADLGVGGMFVDTPRTCFPTGSRVLVRFGLRGSEPPVVATADVRYVQDRIGMGLRFAALALEDRDRIQAFVEEALRRKTQGGPPVRKSARVAVEVPILVRGTRPDGPPFDERTRIVTLSKHGACLVTDRPRDQGGARVRGQRRLGGQRDQPQRGAGRRPVPGARPVAGLPVPLRGGGG